MEGEVREGTHRVGLLRSCWEGAKYGGGKYYSNYTKHSLKDVQSGSMAPVLKDEWEVGVRE